MGPRWGNSKILPQLYVYVRGCIPAIAPTAWNYQGKAEENITMENLRVLVQELDENHGGACCAGKYPP